MGIRRRGQESISNKRVKASIGTWCLSSLERHHLETPILLFLQKDILSKRNGKCKAPEVGVNPDVAGNARRQTRLHKGNETGERSEKQGESTLEADCPGSVGPGAWGFLPGETEATGSCRHRSNTNQLIFQATAALSREQTAAALAWNRRADRKQLQSSPRQTLSPRTERWVTESGCGCVLKTGRRQQLLIARMWGLREKEPQPTLSAFFSRTWTSGLITLPSPEMGKTVRGGKFCSCWQAPFELTS